MELRAEAYEIAKRVLERASAGSPERELANLVLLAEPDPERRRPWRSHRDSWACVIATKDGVARHTDDVRVVRVNEDHGHVGPVTIGNPPPASEDEKKYLRRLGGTTGRFCRYEFVIGKVVDLRDLARAEKRRYVREKGLRPLCSFQEQFAE